jgi:uncharacterized damage-inducible protein DinB
MGNREIQEMNLSRPLESETTHSRKAGALMTTQNDVTTLFLDFSRQKLLTQFWPRLKACVEPLSEKQIWWKPNDTSNSIGNLILHLNGNVRQWLVVSFNREQDERDRPAEFAAESGLTATQLLERLSATLTDAAAVLARLTEADLTAGYDIQGYHVTGLEAVYQVVEHFGLHYGQIAYIAKSLSGRDLGFYRELSKTGRVD